MNALYADAAGEVTDPVGGLADLAARRVRFIGDPEERIAEDYLRILRFFRFHAWYADPGGGIDAEGLAACAALADGLGGLSRERIGAEMRKLLAAPDPAPATAAMAASGRAGRGSSPGPMRAASRRWSMPSRERGSAATRSSGSRSLGGAEPGAALRLSRADLRRLDRLSEAAGGTAGAAELGYRLGAVDGCAALAIRSAWTGTDIDTNTDGTGAVRGRAEAPRGGRRPDAGPRWTGARPAPGGARDALDRLWLSGQPRGAARRLRRSVGDRPAKLVYETASEHRRVDDD